MEEIKFRGKRADGKDKDDNFVIGDYLYDNVTGKHFIIVDFCETIYTEAHDSCIAIEIKKETRGQYIGLKDKNGVEIYDGDNVNVDGTVGIVSFTSGQWGVVEKYGVDSLFRYRSQDIVVIGNIHTKEKA